MALSVTCQHIDHLLGYMHVSLKHFFSDLLSLQFLSYYNHLFTICFFTEPIVRLEEYFLFTKVKYMTRYLDVVILFHTFQIVYGNLVSALWLGLLVQDNSNSMYTLYIIQH